MSYAHTFHIPVMGIGFTIDTPAKVAHLGISSALSLVDDMLMEKMRELYCQKLNLPFRAISEKSFDFRAKRITAYLNVLDQTVKMKMEELKKTISEKKEELEKYKEMFPQFSTVRQKLDSLLLNQSDVKKMWGWVRENLPFGSIDVNIMTKLDKENFDKNGKLPVEFNDAHAALRGFAESTLNSSVILSAGMNPRLYSYMEQFDCFFPSSDGRLEKRIILKVSDYRSAIIQGKFLAKKGLWVSEFRIESGLNCGGHAFATDGHLLGPVLEEFKNQREELRQSLHELYVQALKEKKRWFPETPFAIRVTAQGGVGTAGEHDLLLDYYNLDSVGWGTPFLLVPEVVNIDSQTLKLLEAAGEDDLYLSHISPLGVPFNNLRGNTKDQEKQALVASGHPGSRCIKKYASLNREFTERVICTASRQYQRLKLRELEAKKLDPEQYQAEFDQIVEKACICVGLGTSALLVNDLDTRQEGTGVSVCPGPNAAYFGKAVSLKEMVDHIYGRINILTRTDRPNLFLKELRLYLRYFKKMVDDATAPSEKQEKHFVLFRNNLHEGIEYYKKLFSQFPEKFEQTKERLLNDLEAIKQELFGIQVTRG